MRKSKKAEDLFNLDKNLNYVPFRQRTQFLSPKISSVSSRSSFSFRSPIAKKNKMCLEQKQLSEVAKECEKRLEIQLRIEDKGIKIEGKQSELKREVLFKKDKSGSFRSNSSIEIDQTDIPMEKQAFKIVSEVQIDSNQANEFLPEINWEEKGGEPIFNILHINSQSNEKLFSETTDMAADPIKNQFCQPEEITFAKVQVEFQKSQVQYESNDSISLERIDNSRLSQCKSEKTAKIPTFRKFKSPKNFIKYLSNEHNPEKVLKQKMKEQIKQKEKAQKGQGSSRISVYNSSQKQANKDKASRLLLRFKKRKTNNNQQ